jgi:hypothetical protein
VKASRKAAKVTEAGASVPADDCEKMIAALCKSAARTMPGPVVVLALPASDSTLRIYSTVNSQDTQQMLLAAMMHGRKCL